MSFWAHFLYTDGMREYFVQIVPGVSEIFIFCTKRRKIKQSRRANDAGNQKAVIRHTEFQSAERKKKIGYKTEKRNVDWRRYLPCGSDRPDSCEESDRRRWSRWRECSLCGFRRNDHRDRTWDTEPVYRSG